MSAIADIRSQLFASVLSDCLDAAGVMDQALPSRIRPLDEASVMVGRARTAQFMEVERHEPGTNPYELEIALVDSLAEGEIPVFACSNPARIAPWGELLSTAAQVRGAAGALMDGAVRDIKAIRAMGFAVFHGGIGPLDTKGRGRVMALDVPIRCAGVKVETGDLVIGDADGVVVVPQRVEAEVLALAFDKVKGERRTLEALRAGEKLARNAAARQAAANPAQPRQTPRKPQPRRSKKPALLAGGNPQIAKAYGDAPVQAYIAAMPGWKRDVGRRLDALIARTVPTVRKAVKWNSPFYGVERPGQDGGWFLSFHCFTNYIKVAFFRGTSLRPLPPGASRQAQVRYLDIREDDVLDEAQLAAWVKQASRLPGERM